MASSPLRVILEAGKLRRSGGPASAADISAPPAAPVPRPAPLAANPAPVVKAAPPAAALPSAGVAAPTAVARAPLPTTVQPTPIPPPAVPLPAVTAPVVSAPPVPEVAPAAPPPVASPEPAAALPTVSEPPAAPRLEQPRLLEMVAPELPRAVAEDITGSIEVAIEVTIRADGSVAAVTLLPPVPRQLQRYIVAAVEKWRFAPLPAQRVHRVNLQINGAS